MMRKFKEDMKKAQEFYGSKPEARERSRNFHWSMVLFDTFFAVFFASTIIGLPFSLLFGIAAIRRYEEHLKIRK